MSSSILSFYDCSTPHAILQSINVSPRPSCEHNGYPTTCLKCFKEELSEHITIMLSPRDYNASTNNNQPILRINRTYGCVFNGQLQLADNTNIVIELHAPSDEPRFTFNNGTIISDDMFMPHSMYQFILIIYFLMLNSAIYFLDFIHQRPSNYQIRSTLNILRQLIKYSEPYLQTSLLTEELLRGLNQKVTTRRVCISLDIIKVFDSISWEAIRITSIDFQGHWSNSSFSVFRLRLFLYS